MKETILIEINNEELIKLKALIDLWMLEIDISPKNNYVYQSSDWWYWYQNKWDLVEWLDEMLEHIKNPIIK